MWIGVRLSFFAETDQPPIATPWVLTFDVASTLVAAAGLALMCTGMWGVVKALERQTNEKFRKKKATSVDS